MHYCFVVTMKYAHTLASPNFHAQVVNYTQNSRTVSIFPYSEETLVMALPCNQLNLALPELHHHK